MGPGIYQVLTNLDECRMNAELDKWTHWVLSIFTPNLFFPQSPYGSPLLWPFSVRCVESVLLPDFLSHCSLESSSVLESMWYHSPRNLSLHWNQLPLPQTHDSHMHLCVHMCTHTHTPVLFVLPDTILLREREGIVVKGSADCQGSNLASFIYLFRQVV